eukprot:TRINITY_DN39878_c0_g1_i1.p1 TRINITY_DN39878_c0_g1~~TRINITY_DN39878_c0_g1_i1.p1  ORF type:complete len:392 (-),score=92.16 TRINITY_DN39878_c0_g1_i1:43-1146(-)
MASGDRDSDSALDEYLRVLYGWHAQAIAEPKRDTAAWMNPEDEEFAEADDELRRHTDGDEALRESLAAKAAGKEPLHVASVGGLEMRTSVQPSADARSEPLLATEVRLATCLGTRGLKPPSGGREDESWWPAVMQFPARRDLPRHAGVLWPSSLRFTAALLPPPQAAGCLEAPRLLRPGSRVLELGAGVGFLGAILALLGCSRVLLTDHPAAGDTAVQGARANVPKQAAEVISGASLDWGEPVPPEVTALGPWETIVACDVLAYPAVHGALVETLASLAAPDSEVLLSFETRCPSDENGFFALARERFTVEEIWPAAPWAAPRAASDCHDSRDGDSAAVAAGIAAALGDDDDGEWRLARLRPLALRS